MTEQTIATTSSSKEKLRITKKFELWCQLFLDKKSETYGNATQSAIKAYKLKPRQYASASQMGYTNLRKVESLGLKFAEDDGLKVQDWFKILASKAVKGTYEQTADFMQRMGMLEKPINAAPGNQNNLQFNFGDLAETFTQARKARGLDIPTTDTGAPSSTGSSS